MLDGEKLLTLREAARWLAEARGLSRTYHGLRRWATAGVRGVVLESLSAGGRLHTSREALERFFEATTARQGLGGAGGTGGAGGRAAGADARRGRLLNDAARRAAHEEGLRRCRELGMNV